MPTDSVTLWLPGYFPPSLNQTQHAHWRSVRRHKKVAGEHLLVACIRRCRMVPVFVGPVQVVVSRLYSGRQRPLDQDNLIGSVKPLIDSLRARKAHANQITKKRGGGAQGGLGVIADDDPGLLDLSVDQHRCPWLTQDKLVTVIEITGERQQ